MPFRKLVKIFFFDRRRHKQSLVEQNKNSDNTVAEERIKSKHGLRFTESPYIHLFQAILLLLIITLSMLFIKPLRDMANKKVELIKYNLIAQLEGQLGMNLSYDSISPALLSVVTVRNLKISFEEGDFIAKKLRIYFNPLHGILDAENDISHWITRIALLKGHINLNISDADNISFGTIGIRNLFSPLEDKTIVFKDFSVTVKAEEIGLVEVENVTFQLEGYGDLIRYELKGYLNSDKPMSIIQLGKVSIQLESSGNYSPLNSNFNGRVDLLETKSSIFNIKPISVDITYRDNQFSLQRVGDERPFNISTHISEEGIDISGEFVNLIVRDIVQSGVSLQVGTPWFNSIIDGFFMVSIDMKNRDIVYDLDLNLTIPEKAGLPWPWSIDVNLNGTQSHMDIAELFIATPRATVEYTGTVQLDVLALTGQLYIDVNRGLSAYPIDIDFQVNTTDGVITAKPIRYATENPSYYELSFLMIQEEKQYYLSLAALPGHSDNLGLGHILIDAMLDFETRPEIYGFVTVDGFEASDAARLLNADNIANTNIVSNTLFNFNGIFEANLNEWMVYIENASIVSKKNPENHVVMHGRVTPDNWSLDGVRINWNDYTLDGRCFSQTRDDGGYARGRLVIEDALYPIEADWTPNGPLRISSLSGIQAVFGPATGNGRTMAVNVSEFKVPLMNDNRLLVDLDLRGIIGREQWNISLQKCQFTLIQEDPEFYSSIELIGHANPRRFELSAIDFTDSFGSLYGNALFTSSREGNLLSGNLTLNSGFEESYSLYMVHDDEAWDIDLEVNSGRMERIGIFDIQGYFNIQGSLTGSLLNPLVALDISVRDGFLGAKAFSFDGKLDMNSGNIQMHDLNVFYKDISINSGLLLMNMETGSIRATAELSAAYNQALVSTGFSMGIDFGKSISPVELASLRDMEYAGTLATRALMWNNKHHLPPLTFQFTRTSESIIVQSSHADTLDIVYSFADGRLDVMSGAPMPIVVHGGGTIEDGQLDLHFPKFEIDPILINYVMVRDPILLQYHVVFQEGVLAGNLDIRGSMTSPELHGSIKAVNLKVDTPYTYADIQPTSFDIVFDGNTISTDRVNVAVGDGIVYGEGYIVLEGWKITDMDMTYGCQSTDNSDGVPVSYPLMSVYIDGLATAEIRMTGDFKGFHLEGDISMPFLKASLGSPQVPVMQRKPGTRPNPVTIDFIIRTGTNCTFYLPNEQLKIVKAIAEPNNTLALDYNNYPKELSLVGTLPIKSGDIYYFDRNFQITQGAIVFNESFGDFDPIMQLRAETRVMDEDNEEVSVALVYNSPIKSDFKPRIETVPARSEIEILALFGQAVTPYGEAGATELHSVILATGGMFAQVGLVQPFEEVIREGLNLDMVTIQTDIIENTLADSLKWGNDSTVSNTVTGLGRYLNNTSIYAGKYIGNALFVSGSVSARYFEEQRFRSVFGGLEFETSVSLEMATPFFDIEWSYTPHPTVTQNIIADNAITLKWQFTY